MAKWVLGSVCLVVLSNGLHAVAEDPVTKICGPRCVQYVLNWYGQDEQIEDLVDEVMAEHVSIGASLDDIAEALTRRGIHVSAWQVRPGFTLSWEYPVVVYLDEGPLGHFVVGLPSSTANGDMDIWDGAQAVSSNNRKSLAARRPTAVLLTSPTPISRPSRAFQGSFLPWPFWHIMLAVMLLFPLFLWFRRPSGQANAVPSTGE